MIALSSKNKNESQLISVVVPLKNKEKEIGRCIESILSQTYKNFEVIIVDGNSTDRSLDIARSYHDQRIQVIIQKSKGAAAGRNEGILAAKSEIIAFLDADDEYLPEFLETIVRLSQKYPEAGMYGARGYAVSNEQIVTPLETVEIETDYIVTKYFEDVLQHGELSTSGSAIRKSVFKEIGMFNEELIWYEDVEMFARIGYLYPVARSRTYGFVYHLTASNKITDSIPILPEEHPVITYLQKQPLELLTSREDWQYIQPYIESLHIAFAGAQVLARDKNGARNSLSKINGNYFQKQKKLLIMASYLPSPALNVITRVGIRYKIRTNYMKLKMLLNNSKNI